MAKQDMLSEVSEADAKFANSSRGLFDKTPAEQRAKEGTKINDYMWEVDLLKEEEGYNTRDLDSPRVIAKIREYADALKRGDKFPVLKIKVIKDVRYVRDGLLTLRAFKLAQSEGFTGTRLKCTDVQGDAAMQDLVIIKSDDGLPLLPLERAKVYVRMMTQRGLTVEEIARLDGRTEQSIMSYINAYNLPEELKEFINKDLISLTFATQLHNKFGANAAEIVKSHLARRATTEDLQTSMLAAPVVKERRLTAKDLGSLTGYRPRFSQKLVEDVTDGLRDLNAQLAASTKTDDGFIVKLSPDLMEKLKRLTAEVEPLTLVKAS